MNYRDPELIERLASEYVLGTMMGKARLRFERLMMESYRIRQAVWEWEQRLYPLCEDVGDGVCAEVPTAIWPSIQARIKPSIAPVEKKSLGFWQIWGSASAALVLVMAVFLFQPILYPSVSPENDYMAVFNNEQAQPLWLVSSDLTTGEITVRAVNASAAAANQAFELWMLPAAGQAPKSMGLMPVAGGKVQFQMNETLLAVLRNAQGLAVSLEPAGGSPTGLPTGPVLYQSQLIEL